MPLLAGKERREEKRQHDREGEQRDPGDPPEARQSRRRHSRLRLASGRGSAARAVFRDGVENRHDRDADRKADQDPLDLLAGTRIEGQHERDREDERDPGDQLRPDRGLAKNIGLDEQPAEENNRDREEEAHPAGGDHQTAGRDIGFQADEEEGQDTGEKGRDRRILQRALPVEILFRGRAVAGVALFTFHLRADRIDVGGRYSRFTRRHQTFSTSGLPSSPEGRKINTIARIENAATSLYSTVK